jgi:dolichol-phosphate mannosyltransferase
MWFLGRQSAQNLAKCSDLSRHATAPDGPALKISAMNPKPNAQRFISVVVPVLNEEAGISTLQARLDRLREVFAESARLEFVFVDDGSTDRTGELLRSTFVNSCNCQILTHSQNRGVGAAFRTGFAQATGSIVCSIDADCTYEPESLKKLVDLLDTTGADIAVASPYHPQGAVEDVHPWRLFVSRACSMGYRLISPVALYTYTSIFRAYRREVVKTVPFDADGFVSAAEILIRASERGFRIVESPMTLRGRKVGTSKLRVVKTIRTHLRMMGGVVWRRAMQRLRGTPGHLQSAYHTTRTSLISGSVEPVGTSASGFDGKE